MGIKLYVGDSHGKFENFNRVVMQALAKLQTRGIEIDQVISVGDFGFWPRVGMSYSRSEGLEQPVRFIDGNHEDHDTLSVVQLPDKNWDCEHIKRGSFEDGVMHMGGATSIDRAFRTVGWDYFEEENISYADFNRAVDTFEAADEPCFLICAHDTVLDAYPHLIHSNKAGRVFTDSNASALQALVEALRPRTYVHGHHHVSARYVMFGTHFVSLDRCCRKNADFTKCTIAITDTGDVIDWW